MEIVNNLSRALGLKIVDMLRKVCLQKHAKFGGGSFAFEWPTQHCNYGNFLNITPVSRKAI